jgi:alkylation response protein AidB-like acyl-CoA dehydrogenase
VSWSRLRDAATRQIALLKSYSTSCAQETARDAVQIFGGRGITRTGMGRHIEHVCFLLLGTRPIACCIFINFIQVSPNDSFRRFVGWS